MGQKEMLGFASFGLKCEYLFAIVLRKNYQLELVLK